jgi:competence protein ComEC
MLRISNGVRAALLVSDLERPQEKRLVAHARRFALTCCWCRTTVARRQAAMTFWAPAQPTWALVQAGYRNRYGHPAPPVM